MYTGRVKKTLYQINLEVDVKSSARILGLPVGSFIVGEKFDAVYILTNKDEKAFLGGHLSALIRWPVGESRSLKIDIPHLEPGETCKLKDSGIPVLSQGYTTFQFSASSIEDEGIVITSKYSGVGLFPYPAWHFIVGKTREEIYQYWALLVSAIGLGIIALEKILQILRFFL